MMIKTINMSLYSANTGFLPIFTIINLKMLSHAH